MNLVEIEQLGVIPEQEPEETILVDQNHDKMTGTSNGDGEVLTTFDENNDLISNLAMKRML